MAHYFTDNRSLDENRKEHTFRFLDRLYIFTTDNGVFSKTGVDYGSYVLLKAISKEELHGRILDMGCGYGTLGIITKSLFPSSEVTMADINPRAVELWFERSGMYYACFRWICRNERSISFYYHQSSNSNWKESYL